MKVLAFAIGLCIAMIGATGILVPSELVWIAERSGTSAAFYLIATVRIAFGLVLVAAASVSRAPKGLRILGCVIVIAGIVTALMGLLGIERARAMIDSWLQQGSGVIRITSGFLVALGGFVAYACAPVGRNALRITRDWSARES